MINATDGVRCAVSAGADGLIPRRLRDAADRNGEESLPPQSICDALCVFDRHRIDDAGALVDVMDALPRELRGRAHEVAVALPFYREIREDPTFREEDTGVTVDIRVGDKTYIAEYLEGRSASGMGYSRSNVGEIGCGANIFAIRGHPVSSPINGATV